MNYRAFRHLVWIGMALLLLGACTNSRHAPVIEGSTSAATRQTEAKKRQATAGIEPESTPNTYRIKPGDTLYTIAWRFGLDHRQIVAWNRLTNPDRILVDQTLTLVPPGTAQSAVSQSAARASPAPASRADNTAAARQPVHAAAPSAAGKPAPAATSLSGTPAGASDDIAWRWPAEGVVSRSVAASGAAGLDIRGQRGAAVVAAGAGKVVYSGSGLRGYGQLIIIKHNDAFLSAYAHNDQLLVAEGASVQAGQKIASMGDSEAREVMLHFEIRRNGKAVEPSQYLPKR